jgi:hypothetical protein
MSASQTFKFAGSTIAVLTEFVTNSPASAITAITKADPAVVTCVGHGLVDGQVVKLTGIVGMTELNTGVFVVDTLTSDTFALVDQDSTSYGTYVSGGSISEGEFSNFCELTGYNRQGSPKPEIDSTSLCSDAAEYELGLRDFGTTQLDFKFAPQTAIQLAIKTFDASGDKLAVRVDLPNSGGRMVQLGFVQQTTESAAVNGIWTGSITIRNTGARVDFAAA